MSDPTQMPPNEVVRKIEQLNRDLVGPAQQIAELLRKFNADTLGHGVDITVRVDWQPIVRYDLPFGAFALTGVRVGAEPIQLPGPARRTAAASDRF